MVQIIWFSCGTIILHTKVSLNVSYNISIQYRYMMKHNSYNVELQGVHILCGLCIEAFRFYDHFISNCISIINLCITGMENIR